MDDMAKPRGLVLRGRIYYYRKRIPKDLVLRYGKKEYPISLETDDYQTAVGRCHEEAAKLEAEFSAIRARRALFTTPVPNNVSASALEVSEKEAIAIARALVTQRLTGYDAATAREVKPPSYAELSDLRIELSGEIGGLMDVENEECNQQIQLSAKRALEQSGRTVDKTYRLDKRILDLTRRALMVASRIELARLSGDMRDNPEDALFAGLGNNDTFEVVRARRSSETVGTAMVKFWERVISLEPKAPKTIMKYKAYSAVVVKFFGADTAMSDITRDRCHEFRDLVARLPPNYTKTNDAPPPEATLEEIVAYADRKGLKRIAYATQELYLARMTTFLNWARKERITPDLDVSDIRPRGKAPEKHALRSSFNAVQLTAIFTAPIFSGCKNDGRGFRTPGNRVVKRSRYWVPLIGLCTGMRESEILRLRASQVKRSNGGIDFIDLSKEVGKNKFSRREVPIHSLLLKAGFLKFVDSKRVLKDDALFPEVPIGADGTQTSIFSKRFATFLKGCGIKGIDMETCFHMFRHTLKDALDRGQVPESYIEAIQGWSREMKMSRSYGDGMDADTLKPWIEAAKFPEFDTKCIVTD